MLKYFDLINCLHFDTSNIDLYILYPQIMRPVNDHVYVLSQAVDKLGKDMKLLILKIFTSWSCLFFKIFN